MRIKSLKPIIMGLFVLLTFVSVGLILIYTDDEPMNDSVSQEIVLEAKKESETLPDETSQPLDNPKSSDISIKDLPQLKDLPKLEDLPKLVFPKPLSEYLDSGKLEDMKELQAIVTKHTEELEALGMLNTSARGKTYPAIESAKKLQAELAEQTTENQRRFERQIKGFFESKEKMDRAQNKVQEADERLDAWLAKTDREWIQNAARTGTTPLDTTSKAWKTDLETYMSELDTEMVSKFPMGTMVRHLTKEEYDTYFDTEESRTFIERQQKQMLTEISRQLKAYLSDNDENRNEKIDFIRSRLLQDWNTDIVEKINKQLE